MSKSDDASGNASLQDLQPEFDDFVQWKHILFGIRYTGQLFKAVLSSCSSLLNNAPMDKADTYRKAIDV